MLIFIIIIIIIIIISYKLFLSIHRAIPLSVSELL